MKNQIDPFHIYPFYVLYQHILYGNSSDTIYSKRPLIDSRILFMLHHDLNGLV